jgi:hypothetical protein
MPLTVRQQAYLSRFSKIDAAKVGEYIGRGQQYSVYSYGDSRVIKIPHLRWWYPNATADDQKRDLDFLNENFPENSMPTSIHVAGQGRAYCVLQEKVEGRNMTTVEENNIKREFEEILERNRRLVREAGISLDFLGMDGIRSCYRVLKGPGVLPELSNLLVVEDDHIKQQKVGVIDNMQSEPQSTDGNHLYPPIPEVKKETIFGPIPGESISTAVHGWLAKETGAPLVSKASRIVIPDFTLLRLKDGPDSDLRRIIYRVAFKANRTLMKMFWGADIA